MKLEHLLMLILCASLLVFFSCMPPKKQRPHRKIGRAVSAYMALYPRATLQDLYKNMFQDRFGPGHLVQDTAHAGAYLRSELGSCGPLSGALIEPAGWEGNYYRVNLAVIQQGLITYDDYFDAFVRSVNSITPPTVKEWSKEWHRIVKAIETMKIEIDNAEADAEMIDSLLMQGQYVVHHSAQFEREYKTHYRIFSKKIVEKEFPFLLK